MDTQTQSSMSGEEQYDLQDFAALLVKKRFPDASPEVAAEMENDVIDRLDSFINAALLEHLPEKELPAFEQLLDAGSDLEIQMFLEDRIPNVAEVTVAAMKKFADIYLGGSN